MFGIGPAGTGKTYLAMAQAVSFLLAKRVSRIILARPAVEAGEKLGFLPGDLQEKVNPYLRPLYDALYDMIEIERAERLLERGTIEVAPIAFMRGRTLNDAFVILDEAQNTTSEQMKMFLTRLGFGSKAVITGDVTQIDLPAARTSGLVEAMKVVGNVEGIAFVHFDDKDVVRHSLVQQIVKAYEAYGVDPDSRRAPAPGAAPRHRHRRPRPRRARDGGLGRWLVARRAGARRAARSAIALVSDARIRALNQQYREGPPTDVLSSVSDREPDGSPRLGDIVIATGVARRQAREAGHSYAAELQVLALHGLLHLLGYDHHDPDDRGPDGAARSAAAAEGRPARAA